MTLYKGKGVWDQVAVREHAHFDDTLDRDDPNFDSEDVINFGDESNMKRRIRRKRVHSS